MLALLPPLKPLGESLAKIGDKVVQLDIWMWFSFLFLGIQDVLSFMLDLPRS